MSVDKSLKLEDEDKIWRISSLTSFVDFETKIILLPIPESKREVKIKDTKYTLESIGDLLEKKDKIENQLILKEQEKENKRYEDKTEEEI